MTLFQSILLGIVQGLTEFLPISSSAHLVLVPHFLGWNIPPDQVFIFDVLVQLGTLAAVILYFWKILWSIIKGFVSGIFKGKPLAEFDSRLGWFLILATIPAGILGVFIKDQVEAAFNSPLTTGLFLFVTAVILLIAERLGKKIRVLEQITWIDALVMGLFQALSIFPGISRSGSTISGGMVRGLDRTSAARFSFLMSIPVMLAAGLLASVDMINLPGLKDFLPVVAAGFLAAALSDPPPTDHICYLLCDSRLRSYPDFTRVIFLLQDRKSNAPRFTLTCFLAVLALTASACRPVPAAPRVPTLEIVTVQMTPTLRAYQPVLAACASELPGVGLVIQEVPVGSIDLESSDLALRLGESPTPAGFLAGLGEIPIIMIVPQAATIDEISLDELARLYTLQPGAGPADIQLFTYPPGDDLRLSFETLVGVSAGRLVREIPDQNALFDALADHNNSLGFTITNSDMPGIKQIRINTGDPSQFSAPVLALAENEPAGSARSLLACLQAHPLDSVVKP